MIQSMQPKGEAFQFSLMRRQLVDAAGNPVDGDGPDPEQWALADALSDANAAADLLPLGRGRMTVLSLDEREFVRQTLMHEPEPGSQFIRTLMEMDEGAERTPAMDDLVAVLLPEGMAVVYEVVIASADLELPAEEANNPDAVVWASLPLGHAILRRGPDLPIVRIGPSEELDQGHGGNDAQH